MYSRTIFTNALEFAIVLEFYCINKCKVYDELKIYIDTLINTCADDKNFTRYFANPEKRQNFFVVYFHTKQSTTSKMFQSLDQMCKGVIG